MLRIMGAVLLMVGTGGLGHLIANGRMAHVDILRRLIAAVRHLESIIFHAPMPLSTALRQAARHAAGEAEAFLVEVAEALDRGTGESPAGIWRAALDRHLPELMLTPVEYEALLQLGAVLGGSDREDQRRHLTLAETSLDQCLQEAAVESEKNRRIWRYMGFGIGAMIVLMLY